MTTRAKLNLSVLATGALLWLNILSYPLGFARNVQLLINLVAMIPISLNFVFLRRLRAETAREVAAGRLPASTVTEALKRARRRLIALWIFLVPFVLSFPFWLPRLSGVSVGRTGDLLVSLATLAMISFIFWLMIRRMGRPNHDGKKD
jgi:hypothetical protein